jgi:tryptophan-rich sensory protein
MLPGLVFFAITFAIAAVGALFTPGPWYEALAKPAWTPPGWVFAPVWTALYAMIAVAGWLIWSARARIDSALLLWGVQLALNGIWSWLFFGLENPGLAAVDIVVLLLAIVATIRAFAPVSRPAAALLLPYALWVGFATALNIAIWRLNA